MGFLVSKCWLKFVLLDSFYIEKGKSEKLLMNIECNIAAKEHVREAERAIRTIKEQAQGLIATLPFKDIPQWMKIKFIYFVVLWLNAFPVNCKE